MTEAHTTHIKRAIDLSVSAIEHENHPFGSILVIDDKEVVSAENSVITDKDVTRHAELNLVSLASKQYSSDELNHAVLYTSTEPCAMCCGAIYGWYWKSGLRLCHYTVS